MTGARRLAAIAHVLRASATLLAARRGHPVRIEGVSDPADPDRELYETDALLPGLDATLGGPTFEEWLDPTFPARAAPG